ncbi:MAG: hypothetical protein PHV85_07790 [Desulfovibrionaceae bacterium]|nr:hypothetical protein [Desulfovibrionaceae bacterium]
MRSPWPLIALLLCLALPASAGPLGPETAKPAPTAFRGLPFGADIGQIKGLEPVRKYPGTYYRPDEKLRLGSAELVSVAYYFRDKKLRGVGVAFEGETNYFIIKDELIGKYGPGRQVGARYGWMWPNFSLELRFEDDTNSGALIYTLEQ